MGSRGGGREVDRGRAGATWMRRPRNSSSLPRSPHAETRAVSPIEASHVGSRPSARRPGSAPRRDHPWPGRPRRSFRRRGAPDQGIELAQVARRSREVLLRSIHHPEQLCDHVLALRSPLRRSVSSSKIHGFPSAPRASSPRPRRMPRTHCAPRLGRIQAAGDDHRQIDSLDQLTSERVIGRPLVLGRRRARMERDPRDSGLLGKPRREPKPSRPPGSSPDRSFTVTGRPLPPAPPWRSARQDRGRTEAPRRPGLATLRTGQPMLMSIRSAPASATIAAADRITSGS